MKKLAFPVRFLCLFIGGISIASLSLLTTSCHEAYVDKDKVYTITFFHDNAYYNYIDENNSQLIASAETILETDMKGRLSGLPPTPVKQNDVDLNSGDFIRSFAFVGWYTTGGTEVSEKTVFHTDTLVVAKWKASDEVDKNAIGKLADDLAFLRNADIPTEITFTVTDDEDIKTQFLDFGGEQITITVKGIANPNFPTLFLSGFGALFVVEKGVTLELENIVLQGRRNTSSLIVVNSGGKLIMNDGTLIKGNGNENKEFGGGVTVNMGGVFEMKGGVITENYAADPTEDWVLSTSGGGGVQVRGGTFYMTGGQITENQGFNGGGVLVNRGGKFYMGPFQNPNKDGDIFKNYADSGGGVKVLGGINNLDHPNSPTDPTINSEFHMLGVKTPTEDTRGRIVENQGVGGGVVVGFRGTFYLKGGVIENNLGSDGGGLFNSRGVVYMYDGGEIIRNRGPWSAGGIMNQGFFYMYGGKISDNFGGLGGGVCNFMPALLGLGGWFHMWGGEISGNTADGSGGGVVNTGFFNMHGGEIYGNKTNVGNGAGIYNGSPGYDEDGIFVITGGVIYGTEEPAGFNRGQWDNYKNVDRGGTGGSFYILGGQVVWGRRGYYELVEAPGWQWMTQEQKKADPLAQFIKTGTGPTDYMYTFIPDTRYEDDPALYQGRSFVPDISKGKPFIEMIYYDGTETIKVPSLNPIIKEGNIPYVRQSNHNYTNKTYEVIHWNGTYPASGPLKGASIVTGTQVDIGVYIEGAIDTLSDFNQTEWKGNAP
jgi:hypothetical protein